MYLTVDSAVAYKIYVKQEKLRKQWWSFFACIHIKNKSYQISYVHTLPTCIRYLSRGKRSRGCVALTNLFLCRRTYFHVLILFMHIMKNNDVINIIQMFFYVSQPEKQKIFLILVVSALQWCRVVNVTAQRISCTKCFHFVTN